MTRYFGRNRSALRSSASGGGGGIAAPITINGVREIGKNAVAPILTTYQSGGLSYPASINYAFSGGYHYFTLPAGTYNVIIRGAEGSGTQHGYGANITATMVVTAATRMVALVGTAGAGNYSGGGGTYLAATLGTDDQTTSTAVLVAGGGGSGYVSLGSQADGGNTAWNSTTQRTHNTDCPAYNGGVYDGGASFGNFFNPAVYNCTTSASRARNFVEGGTGGQVTACGSGSSQEGGFGGGGGSCPAGGGGYYGGAPGGNSPQNTGGGGGTSYRLTSGTVSISTWADGSLNGSTRSANPGTAHGFLQITST